MIHIIISALLVMIVVTLPSVWWRFTVSKLVLSHAYDPLIKPRVSDHRYNTLVAQARAIISKTATVTVPAAIAGLVALSGVASMFASEQPIDDATLFVAVMIIAFALSHLWTLTPVPAQLVQWLQTLMIEKHTIILENVTAELGRIGTEIDDLEKSNGDPAKINELVEQLNKLAAVGVVAKEEIDRLRNTDHS